MSLVGPRPPLPEEVEQYKRWQRRRLRMRPGLTCLWVISGRDQVDFETWMRMDMQYIDTWSLGTRLEDHAADHSAGTERQGSALRTMHLVPTQDEVMELLRQTGGLRKGHFEYPNGLHTDEYLQVALTMRHYQSAKILSVGLSRLIRAHADLRAMIPELSIVAPATGGLPVAYGVCEALRAHQVYWAERDDNCEAMRFRQFLEITARRKGSAGG